MDKKDENESEQDKQVVKFKKYYQVDEKTQQEVLSKLKIYDDFPHQGITFRDFFTLMRCPEQIDQLLDLSVKAITSFAEQFYKKDEKGREHLPTAVAGLELRGVVLGVLLAQHLRLPFVPIRKPNKLPGEKFAVDYKTEYSEDRLEMQKDVFAPNSRVLIVDDLLATGGSLNAASELIEKATGSVWGLFCVFTYMPSNGQKELKHAEKYINLFDAY